MIDVEIEDERWDEVLPDAAELVEKAASSALQSAHPGAINVLLTNDDAVRELNARFRSKDRPTNVLSFPSSPNPENLLGDIALAYETCAREADEQGKPLAHHLQHLVAHGVLHLVGYDHESDTEAEAMEALEREILSGLGVPDPYRPDQGSNG